MPDRRVGVKLSLDAKDYESGLARAGAATSAFHQSVEKQSGESGRRSGHTFAKQFSVEFRQRSVFISAVVGAALTAGAPVAIAGAAMLFGGIAAVAGAQSLEVKNAWIALGKEIRDGAVDDARVIIPELTGMAADLGEAFQDIRPQLRSAFEATAPLVQDFTDGMSGLVTNMMPGFVKTLRNAAPVMQGFQVFLEDVGQGLGDMFAEMSDHSNAAGQAFAAWGDVFAELLPLIGELLGQGAELAQVVLPPLADVLGLVHSALSGIGPLLPAIVAGFVGLKIARIAAGGLGMLASAFNKVAAGAESAFYQMGDNFAGRAAVRANAAAEKVGKSVGGMADNIGKAALAMPALGIVISGFAGDLADASSEEDRWAEAILQGGQAAAAAYKQYQEETYWGRSIDEAVGLASSWEDARDKANGMKAAMSPLALAQQDVTTTQEALAVALGKYKANSPEVIAATNAYKAAQADVEYQSGLTQMAIEGVTQAMIDQADTALAALDSGFAYRHSTDQLEDAQEKLADALAHVNDTNKDTKTSHEDVERAQLDVEEQTYKTALAYGQQQADLSGLNKDSAQYARIIQEQMLAELYRLRDAAGPQMRVAIDKQIKALQDAGVQLDTTAAKAANTRDRVREIPQYTRIRVEADMGSAQKTLSDFVGRHWTAIISSQVQGSGTSGSGGTVRRIATGGWVSGPGTPTSDSIPALLSNGEFVVNARSAARHRPLLESINGGVRRYATGGMVQAEDGSWVPRSFYAKLAPGLVMLPNGQIVRSPNPPAMKDKIAIHYDVDMSGANAGMLAARQRVGAMIGVGAPGAPMATSGNAAIVRSMAASIYGWTGAQWNALYALIMKESGFRNTAQNPTSTAYGMFQFLNSTWGGYGVPKTSDPRLQTIAGLRYISSKYGSPSSALAFHQAHNWYANGGVIGEPVFGMGLRSGQSYSFAERGPEVVLPTSRGFGGGGVGGPRTVIYDQRQIQATAMDARSLARELSNSQRDLEFLHG